MTPLTTAMSYACAILIGFLIGHRLGFTEGLRVFYRMMERLDVDKTMLKAFWDEAKKGPKRPRR